MTVGLNPLRAGKISAEVLIQALTGQPGPHNFDLSSGKLTLGLESGGINSITKAEVDSWYDSASNTVKYPE
jgi:hypothetical protein